MFTITKVYKFYTKSVSLSGHATSEDNSRAIYFTNIVYTVCENTAIAIRTECTAILAAAVFSDHLTHGHGLLGPSIGCVGLSWVETRTIF